MISIGTIGLIKAINTFNPEKNIKLATYASRCIENEILMYLRRNNKTKLEVSIDEPLNVDWDGNELLLSDILGTEEDTIYRDLEQEAEKKEKKKPVGSEFYNTLACLVGDYFMKIGATLPPCDWKTKDAYANMDIAGYNYGLFRYKHDLKKYPKRLILGTETFCKDAYSFWEIAKKNKRILGDFVWSGWEYIGETGDGAAEYEDYKGKMPHTRMTGNNGRIDLLGTVSYTHLTLPTT